MRDEQGRELQRVVEDRIPEFSSRYLHYLGELIAKELRERDRKRRPMTKADIEERYQANRPGMLRHLGDVITSQEFTDFAREEQDKFRKRLERETADIQRQRERAKRERERFERLRSQIANASGSGSAIEEDKHEDYHEPGYEDQLREEMEKLRRAKEWDAGEEAWHTTRPDPNPEAYPKLRKQVEEISGRHFPPDLHDYAKRLETQAIETARQQRQRLENLKRWLPQEEDTPTATDARNASGSSFATGLEKRVTYIEEVISELRGQTRQLDAGIVRWDREIEDFRQELRGTRQHSVDAINQIRRETLPIHQQAEENAGILELHRERIKELSERVEKLGAQAGEVEGELGEISTLRDRIGKLEGQHDESSGGATVIPIHLHEAEATPEYGQEIVRGLLDADKHTKRIRRTRTWVENGDPKELVFEITWDNGVTHYTSFAPAKMSESLKFVIVPERYWIDLLPVGERVEID